MIHRRMFSALSLIAMLLLSQNHGIGQDASAVESFSESVRAYHFRSVNQGEADFELQQKPIMVWSNPATFDQKGAVFVWMKEGRPMVLGTLFDSVHSGQPRSSLELLSLSDSEIVGQIDDVEFWRPLKSGLQWGMFDDSLEIGNSSQRRLLQMRQISRNFETTLTSRDGTKLQLRLLPTPILTYEPKNDIATEGAIFAFAATGTDPDVLLVVESRTVGEKTAFHYAFARFNFRELVASKGNVEIWRAGPILEMTKNFLGSPTYRESPYVFIRVK